MSRAVIVASGPSAFGFVPPDDLPVIAVNGAATWLRRFDYWFSLDASQANRSHLCTASARGAQCHIAGEPWLLHAASMRLAHYWTRVTSLNTYPEPPARYTPEWWLWRLGAVRGVNTEPGRINTGNSAWGAVGLAWHLGFRDIALVGVDASDEPRVEGGKCNSLSHLPLLFASAAPEVQLTSCGRMVAEGVPNKTFGEWYENR